MASDSVVRVEVVCCPSEREVDRVELLLPAGATVLDALRASGVLDRHPAFGSAAAGIWGRVVPADTPLRDGDRVELYRPLLVDPKEARRLRARRQRDAR